MAKSPHTPEWKITVIKKYLSGEGSYERLAVAYGIGSKTLKEWVHRYQEHGASAFYRTAGNAHYSKEFKTMCVESVLKGEGSVDDIVAKNNISSRSVLNTWITLYNANMELKDYEPKREVYMAEAGRKTTLEERKEIVEYCIAHGNDYKGAASQFEVSYSQVYSWVKKCRESGEEGLSLIHIFDQSEYAEHAVDQSEVRVINQLPQKCDGNIRHHHRHKENRPEHAGNSTVRGEVFHHDRIDQSGQRQNDH